MKTTSINSIVRSGMIIITALSLAACGNTVKNNVNKVKGDTITAEDVAVVETPRHRILHWSFQIKCMFIENRLKCGTIG